MDAPAPAAPPVVAVLVTHDPGPWFEEVLDGLAGQDYPAFAVLVIDTGEHDPTPRVASRLPGAYVRRIGGDAGYGAAVNEALRMVEGAAFLLLVHDDVAVPPDAVTLLVEEAFRSNAGIVGTKLVSWDDPRLLLDVGLGVDKAGVPAPRVEPGELDQEQHDAVRDVFAVSGGCTLIRADLFQTVHGFDPGITFLGDDVDLCWRAHTVGARVVMAPQVKVRHQEALGTRRPADDRRRLQARHRLRTTLVAYGFWSRVRVLPQAAVLALVEAVAALVTGHPGQARDVLTAWTWNLRHHRDVRRRRALVRAARTVSDRDVRDLQIHGSARFRSFTRGQLGARLGRDPARGDGMTEALRRPAVKLAVAAWVALALVVLVGSRDLISAGIPSVGQLAELPGPGVLLRTYLDGWTPVGMGSSAPAAAGIGLFGLAGAAFLGFTSLLRTVLVVGLLPLGYFAAWRAARPLGSLRAQVVAVVLYAVIPVPYNALATGDWGALALWAAAPAILGAIARLGGLDPFHRATPRPWGARVAGLALVLALVAVLEPVAPLVAVAVAVVWVVASLVVGGVAGSLRALGGTVVAALVAVGLHLPWLLGFAGTDSAWTSIVGVPAPLDGTPLSALLRFDTGPWGASTIGWAIVVAAALPLLVGRGWRLAWAGRAWLLAAGAWALSYAAAHDLLGFEVPGPQTTLAVAAAALALSGALGMAAFEADVPGYRLGVRQVASVVCAVAAAVAVVPALAAAADGRWGLPRSGFARSVAFTADDGGPDVGGTRLLWVGEPSTLPLGTWPLAAGVGFGLSPDGPPDVRQLWASPAEAGEDGVRTALELAGDGQTTQLGKLLAPYGVRWIVVPQRDAPALAGGAPADVPPSLMGALAVQTDLRRLEVEEALTLYENTAWVPERTVLPPGAREPSAEGGPQAAARAVWAGAAPVLTEQSSDTSFAGDVPAAPIFVAQNAADGWSLRVAGAEVTRQEAFGYATSYEASAAGTATLSWARPWTRVAVVIAQAAAWILVVWFALRRKARRHAPEPHAAAVPLHRVGAAGRTRAALAPQVDGATPDAPADAPADATSTPTTTTTTAQAP